VFVLLLLHLQDAAEQTEWVEAAQQAQRLLDVAGGGNGAQQQELDVVMQD
jgi:hypothetical protein